MTNVTAIRPNPRQTFKTVKAGEQEYEVASELVNEQYQRHFGSSECHPLGNFLNLYIDGHLGGCIGFAPANADTLFLEQYLDVPIEVATSQVMCRNVTRDHIVEIGAFAVTDRTFALTLMASLAPHLLASGFTIAACTVTGPVAGCLSKLGIQSVTLGNATAARVPDPSVWGRYYEYEPVVLAGDIAEGVKSIAQTFGFRAAS